MISVIIPVYNTEQYLKKCLDSVVNQTYRDLEIFLVDDGSTDGSPGICDDYASKDSRIKVFHIPNGGVSAARNSVISECSGEWISFIDSDDWLLPEMYEKMVQLSEKTGADTVCCGAMQGNGEKSEVRNMWRFFEGDTHIYNGKEAVGAIIQQSATLWNKLLSSDYVKKYLFDTKIRYGEDTLFLVNYLLDSKKTVVLKEPLYYYRCNRAGNVVSAGLNDRYLDFILSTQLLFDIMSENGFLKIGLERAVDAIIRVLALIDRKNPEHKQYIEAVKQFAGHVYSFRSELLKPKKSVKQYVKYRIIGDAYKRERLAIVTAKQLIRLK